MNFAQIEDLEEVGFSLKKLSSAQKSSLVYQPHNVFVVAVFLFIGCPRTLFRGNSLAAKCMEQFMKVM